MAKADLTAQRLRELLSYEPETGVFVWLANRGGTARRGSVAGAIHRNGRELIAVAGRRVWASRLAWLYVTGEWPQFEIDHIDGDAKNNAFANLRDVTRSVNQQNLRKAQRSKRSTKLLGAHRQSDGSGWFATITVGGKIHHLGTHKTPEDAHASYIEAKRRLHPGCTI